MSDNAKQRDLPFPQSKEDVRLDTIERIWGDQPKVKTAAKLFDEQAEREAVEIAKGETRCP